MVYIPADLDGVADGESDSERVEDTDSNERADASDVADLRQEVGTVARTLDDLLTAGGDGDRGVEGIAEAVVDDVLDRLSDTGGEMDADFRGFY